MTPEELDAIRLLTKIRSTSLAPTVGVAVAVSLLAEVDRLNAELNLARTECDAWETTADGYVARIAELEVAVVSTRSEMVGRHDDLMSDSEERIAKLEAEQKRDESLIEHLGTTINGLTARIAELETELETELARHQARQETNG